MQPDGLRWRVERAKGIEPSLRAWEALSAGEGSAGPSRMLRAGPGRQMPRLTAVDRSHPFVRAYGGTPGCCGPGQSPPPGTWPWPSPAGVPQLRVIGQIAGKRHARLGHAVPPSIAWPGGAALPLERGTVAVEACRRPPGAGCGANEPGPSRSGCQPWPARVPGGSGSGLRLAGRACHPPSGQIPPPWAWWEIEGHTARAARGLSQAPCWMRLPACEEQVAVEAEEVPPFVAEPVEVLGPGVGLVAGEEASGDGVVGHDLAVGDAVGVGVVFGVE